MGSKIILKRFCFYVSTTFTNKTILVCTSTTLNLRNIHYFFYWQILSTFKFIEEYPKFWIYPLFLLLLHQYYDIESKIMSIYINSISVNICFAASLTEMIYCWPKYKHFADFWKPLKLSMQMHTLHELKQTRDSFTTVFCPNSLLKAFKSRTKSKFRFWYLLKIIPHGGGV